MFKKVFFFITVFALLLVPVFSVHAQYGIDKTLGQIPSLSEYKASSVPTLVGNILGQVLALVGILFFLLMIYGGVTWMTAAGNAEKEKKALGTMISATIGIIIVLSAYVLVSFVITKVGGGTSVSGGTPVVEIGTGTGKCVVDQNKKWSDENNDLMITMRIDQICVLRGNLGDGAPDDENEYNKEVKKQCEAVYYCIYGEKESMCNVKLGQEEKYCNGATKEDCTDDSDYSGCKWQE